jgi:hypothetical protein
MLLDLLIMLFFEHDKGRRNEKDDPQPLRGSAPSELAGAVVRPPAHGTLAARLTRCAA